MGTLRTFLAITPPSDIQSMLFDYGKRIHERFSDAWKFEKREKLHLTLQFFGNLENEDLKKVTAVVRETIQKAEPFMLSVMGVTGYPIVARATVLVLELSYPEELFAMRQSMIGAFKKNGLPAEHRFTPHITLARSRSPGDINERIAKSFPLPSIEFNVTTLNLFASHMSLEGSRYEVLSTFMLGDRGENNA